MRWGRICLNFNLLCVILSLCGFGVLLGFIVTEFSDLPETNVWQSNSCQILENYQQGFYSVMIASDQFENRNQSDSGLDANSDINLGLCARNSLNHSLTLGQNVSCATPRRPIIIEECNQRTPLLNLILLDAEIQAVANLMERHLMYYWIAVACAMVNVLCCLWFCYSYWFVSCGCNDRSYWYCGRNDAKQFFSQFNLGDEFDDVDESFRVDFSTNREII